MEIEFEDIVELNELGRALKSKERILILDLLYKNDECTMHQICNCLDMPEREAKGNLSELKDLLWISNRKVMTHPLTLEVVCSLSPKGQRLFSVFRAIIKREIDLRRSILDDSPTTDTNTFENLSKA